MMKLEKEKATAKRLESQIRSRFVECSMGFGHFVDYSARR
jgi:hypothetical protein